MTITLKYYPDKGFSINEIFLSWGLDREIVRRMLGDNFKPSDNITDLSEYNNGSHGFDIIQRRDIYKNYLVKGSYFFLNYDEGCRLRDLEAHKGSGIAIQNISLNFDMNIQEAVSLLQTLSPEYKQLPDGEYFFKDLKLAIAHSGAMGGVGDLLSYFYCTNDIGHLL